MFYCIWSTQVKLTKDDSTIDQYVASLSLDGTVMAVFKRNIFTSAQSARKFMKTLPNNPSQGLIRAVTENRKPIRGGEPRTLHHQ
jgi:hypothetical protein